MQIEIETSNVTATLDALITAEIAIERHPTQYAHLSGPAALTMLRELSLKILAARSRDDAAKEQREGRANG